MFANVSRTSVSPLQPLSLFHPRKYSVLVVVVHISKVCAVFWLGLGRLPDFGWWLLCRRTYKKVIFSFLVLVRGFLYIRRNGFIYFLYVSGGKTFSLLWLCCPPSPLFFSLSLFLCSSSAPCAVKLASLLC